MKLKIKTMYNYSNNKKNLIKMKYKITIKLLVFKKQENCINIKYINN